MTRFKKGFQFRHNASDVEIINRHDNLILAKISPDFGPAYYDISSVKYDTSGVEHYEPSPNSNGLYEVMQGAPPRIKSLDEMQQAFDDLVTDAKKRAIAAAEARERAEAREKAFIARKQKGKEAMDRSKALNDELRRLAAEAPDVKAFTDSKRVHKIAEELNLLELYKVNI